MYEKKSTYQTDYVTVLQHINNQIDSIIYELENFSSEDVLKIPSEFRHDSYPIIKRFQEAKRLTEESLYNYKL